MACIKWPLGGHSLTARLPMSRRSSTPVPLRAEIDEVAQRIYTEINIGVYTQLTRTHSTL
jgi:glutathionyl-hydroquinone reductase